MAPSALEMTNALNTYFAEQAKLDGTCLVDYAQFDNVYETVFEDTDIADARAVIEARGSTALLDAIGTAVTALGKKLAQLPEARRPGRVQVVIVTDGWENASREWTYDMVKALVKQQTDAYGWDFVFLGANIDAVAVGGTFGIHPDKALTFNIKNVGTVAATSAVLTGYTTVYRGGGDATFSDDDRKAAVDPDA